MTDSLLCSLIITQHYSAIFNLIQMSIAVVDALSATRRYGNPRHLHSNLSNPRRAAHLKAFYVNLTVLSQHTDQSLNFKLMPGQLINKSRRSYERRPPNTNSLNEHDSCLEMSLECTELCSLSGGRTVQTLQSSLDLLRCHQPDGSLKGA